MSTKIILKKSSVSGRIPDSSSLSYGELALNYADGIIYYKSSDNVVKAISAGLDSADTINLIDSAYVQARIGTSNGLDSSGIISFVDSDYIQARQISGLVYNSVSTYVYTADSGQTVFSGADIYGNELSYFSNQYQVFVNGILLVDSADYTALTGNSISLNVPADLNDNITISSFRGGTNATIKTSIVSYDFIAESAQTVISGNDVSGTPLTYGVDTSILVFNNGTLLNDSDDYTATTGNSVVFVNPLTLNDNINIIKMSSSGLVTVDGVIDSIQAAQIATTTIDSAHVTGIINQAYIRQNQITYNTSNFVDSAYVTTQINNLIDGAPGTLDTLNEIAAALNDNDSAYATLVGLIGSKDSDFVQSVNPWVEVTSDITLIRNKKYIVDTSVARTLTLPATPSLGDEITILDGSGNASTNNITVDRNGNKIIATDSDFTIDVDRALLQIVYYNAANGWIVSGTN